MTYKYFCNKLSTYSLLSLLIVCSLTTTSCISYLELDKDTDQVILSEAQEHIILRLPYNESIYKNQTTLYQINRLPLSPSTEIKNIERGLCYYYYEGLWSHLPNFSVLSPIKSGKVNRPDLNVADRSDSMGIRFKGFIQISETGLYKFYAKSSDGSNIYIDDKLVVRNDNIHANKESEGEMALVKGLHSIMVDFFERDGGESLSVSYSGSGFNKMTIPDDLFYRSASSDCI